MAETGNGNGPKAAVYLYCGSFDNMNVSIFGIFSWKRLFMPPKLLFLDYLNPKWGATSTKAKKPHPWMSQRHLSHQA